MTWQEALEIIIEQTKHERYRELCSDAHPDHEAYRAMLIQRASGTLAVQRLDQAYAVVGTEPVRGGCCGG